MGSVDIRDGEIFIISDGVNSHAVFEFDRNGSYNPANVRIFVLNGSSEAQMAQNIMTAIQGAPIGDEGLAFLPRALRTLYLTRTKITDAGVPALHRLPLLRELDLRRTAVSPAARATLETERGIRLVSSP